LGRLYNSILNRILPHVSFEDKNENGSKKSVALNVLFVGGTGQISLTSVREAVAAGHQVTVFNRGKSSPTELPEGVATIVGDIHDQASYANLGASKFDVVCNFMVFKPEQLRQDLATFSGNVGQYIFISSASCYQKPARHYIITEKTPLENPYWEYSQNKIACERLLQDQSKLPYTIVRPSHTIRTRLPIQIGDQTGVLRRMLGGKPVLVTGDGTSPWTLTRSIDFSVPFVRLFGSSRALGQDFHITNDRAFTWDQIHTAIGRAFGVETINFHVPTDTLTRYHREWVGPLIGDKMWTALFNNSKVKSVVGQFTCSEDLEEILAESVALAKHHFEAAGATGQLNNPDHPVTDEDALMDRIIADQSSLGNR
jgi:nucleoside-diphosphate-sugar epimerase